MLHFAKSSYQNISIYLMFSHCFKFSVAFVVVIVVNDFFVQTQIHKNKDRTMEKRQSIYK